ncbi:MAG: DUF5615 family PIN-like protein, partial [Acidimicrobiia bacterium]
MRFLLDQNLSPLVSGVLQAAGHDVVHVRDLDLAAEGRCVTILRPATWIVTTLFLGALCGSCAGKGGQPQVPTESQERTTVTYITSEMACGRNWDYLAAANMPVVGGYSATDLSEAEWKIVLNVVSSVVDRSPRANIAASDVTYPSGWNEL